MPQEVLKKPQIMIAARERGPGPGRYRLPSTVGCEAHDCTRQVQPAYSFGRLEGRVHFKDWSPGPAYYIDPRITRTGMDGTPEYSLLARQKDLNTFKVPSPGLYSPEKVHPQGERHAPQYSISARTKMRRIDPNPAPNQYTLPPIIGSKQPNKPAAPAYVMTNRTEEKRLVVTWRICVKLQALASTMLPTPM